MLVLAGADSDLIEEQVDQARARSQEGFAER